MTHEGSDMTSERRFDVVILGGAISGGSAALLLKRERPELKVLVVEKMPVFDAKVGEATTEMSAMFLTRRLALWQHLELEHLRKEGLRFWFTNERVKGHAQASEAGPHEQTPVPTFQLRRDSIDEHVLATAVAAGAELMRPARVSAVEIGEFDHRVTIDTKAGRETVACRWVLDASGRATVLGKKLGLTERNEGHPTSAVWARWEGIRHMDDVAALSKDNTFAAGNVCSRRLATNHYLGRGYWVWIIPLGNGETSIGVVFDRRLMSLDIAGSARGASYEAHLRSIPAVAELLEGARMRTEDLRSYSHLAYATRQYMGPGWAMMGDAAVFIDPFYSPGLDHMAFSVEATVLLVLAETAGEDVTERIAEHNRTFVRSYWRFFEGVYRDKYFYMGEHDLASAGLLIDTAAYFIFLVDPAYRRHKRFHWMPVFGPKEAFFSYWLLLAYNRRFKRIANARLEYGTAGERNDGRRVVASFELGYFGPRSGTRMMARGLKLWLFAELDLLRLRLSPFRRRRPKMEEMPAMPAMAPESGAEPR